MSTPPRERCQAMTAQGKQCRRYVGWAGTTLCDFHEWFFNRGGKKT